RSAATRPRAPRPWARRRHGAAPARTGARPRRAATARRTPRTRTRTTRRPARRRPTQGRSTGRRRPRRPAPPRAPGGCRRGRRRAPPAARRGARRRRPCRGTGTPGRARPAPGTSRARSRPSGPQHLAPGDVPVDGGLTRQAEDLLTEDVALDLARPARDRLRAGAQEPVLGRRRPPVVSRVGDAVEPFEVERERLQRLHGLAVEQLQDRVLVARRPARPAPGFDAHARPVLDPVAGVRDREALAQGGVADGAVVAQERVDRAPDVHARRRGTPAHTGAALEGEQAAGHAPALAEA